MTRFLCAASICALVGCSQTNSNSATTKNDSKLSPQAISQMETLIAEKEARSPVQRKISSALLYAKYGMPVPSKLASNITPDDSGRVLVDIKGQVSAGMVDGVKSLGGTVTSSSVEHGSIRALVTLDSLEGVAGLAGVRNVRPALQARSTMHAPPVQKYGAKFATISRADRVKLAIEAAKEAIAAKAALSSGPTATTNTGSVSDEADIPLGSARARKFFGIDGTGVNVGVISDSDDFSEAAIASGDLPADQFTIPGQSGRPGTGEGTAMMEIVHDIAPGAKIFFASAFESPEAFADNIRQLRFTYHCDIILDDVGYFFESPYQDDIVAAAVDDVYDDGAMYFSSAGNDGNFDNGTSGAWDGHFTDAGALATLPSGYTVHDFGSGVIGNRVEVAGDPLYLHWAAPGSLDNPAATDDYDLFVLDQDMRNVLIASTDIQDGTDIAFEFIDATIPVNSRIVIAKKAGSASLPVRVQLSGGELALTTTGSSYGHPTARGAVGVAAIDVAEAVGGAFAPGPTTQAELFTSDGYRFIYFNPDNSVIEGGPTPRLQPSMTAPDGVSTTLPGTSGLNPFFGTSAAAPHAGAVAALLKSAQPDKPNWYITQIMASAATDIMAPGNDRDSGWGVVDAFNTLDTAGVSPVVFLELGTVTLSGGFVLPGNTGALSIQLIDSGGRDAHDVVGTLTTSTPGVTIVNGTSTWPTVEDDSPGPFLNNTPLTFAVAPGAACGQKITFNLSVSFSGPGSSPTNFTFTAIVGKASTTQTVTNYTGARVPIPDGNAAGVNVPITLTNVGIISSINFHIQGATCTAAQGSTTVGIDHSWVGDLTATLTSPSGTKITLFDRAGGINNSGNNFCKTILTDSATNLIQNIAIAGAPWTGSFKPEQALSTFSGENANGTWILHMTDNVTIDTGSVRAFSLDTTGFTCTP
jgi:subtilisin-like proprotein convertase family protein